MTDSKLSRSWIWNDEHSGAQIDVQAAIAKSLDDDPSFFEIDWAEWKLKPAALIVKILALSSGINPTHPCASMEWAGKYTKYVTGSAAEKLKVFQDRWPVVSNNLTKNGGDIEVIKPGGAWMDSIRLRDFARLAHDSGWDLPHQFPAHPGISEQSNEIHAVNDLEQIPGFTGRSAIIKAAIEVAWEIEKATGKDASPKAVREKLKEYSNNGERYSDFLIAKKDSDEVWWKPSGGKSKPWFASSCEIALKRWKDSF